MINWFINLTRVQKGVIIVLLTGILVYIYGNFFLKPRFRAIRYLKQEIERSQEKLMELKAQAARLEKLTREYQQLEGRIQRVKEELPTEKEIPRLLTAITTLGIKNGLEFLSFAPQPEQTKEFYSILPLSLDMEGSYHEVGKFLAALANFPRIVNASRITLSPLSAQEDPSVTVSIKMELSTYIFKKGL
jgi:type IV pilus assembly protein PilO